MSPACLGGHDLGVLDMLNGILPQSCVSFLLKPPKYKLLKVHSLVLDSLFLHFPDVSTFLCLY